MWDLVVDTTRSHINHTTKSFHFKFSNLKELSSNVVSDNSRKQKFENFWFHRKYKTNPQGRVKGSKTIREVPTKYCINHISLGYFLTFFRHLRKEGRIVTSLKRKYVNGKGLKPKIALVYCHRTTNFNFVG